VLLAIFPAIAAAVSLYGMMADPGAIARDLDLISAFLPEGALTVLRAELHRLTSQRPAALNSAFAVSFVIALWSASGGFKALVDGLNVAFEARETRGFVRQTVNALLFTAGAILLLIAAVDLGLALPRDGGLSPQWRFVLRFSAWPMLFALAALILAVVYRLGPDRPHPRWRLITWGSAIAALLWVFGTQLFTWYVEHYGSYNRVYGDLGAVVGFLTWIWLSLVVVLLGAEINCELERAYDDPAHQALDDWPK
jgi:membrane protein